MTQNTSTVERFSATINKKLYALCVICMTPTGFSKMPKGSISGLISAALQDYFTRMYGLDILELLDLVELSPDVNHQELLRLAKERAEVLTKQ